MRRVAALGSGSSVERSETKNGDRLRAKHATDRSDVPIKGAVRRTNYRTQQANGLR